jgi:hypothetical protein
MLFPALGMTTAMWLLAAPLLGVEEGFRAALGISVGVAALILLPLGAWNRKATAATAGLGMVLGFANFFLQAPIGALASMASCSVLLIAAGTAPWPVIEERVAAAAAPAKETDEQSNVAVAA